MNFATSARERDAGEPRGSLRMPRSYRGEIVRKVRMCGAVGKSVNGALVAKDIMQIL